MVSDEKGNIVFDVDKSTPPPMPKLLMIKQDKFLGDVELWPSWKLASVFFGIVGFIFALIKVIV